MGGTCVVGQYCDANHDTIMAHAPTPPPHSFPSLLLMLFRFLDPAGCSAWSTSWCVHNILTGIIRLCSLCTTRTCAAGAPPVKIHAAAAVVVIDTTY